MKRSQNFQAFPIFSGRRWLFSKILLFIIIAWAPISSAAENFYHQAVEKTVQARNYSTNLENGIARLPWGRIVDTPYGAKNFYKEKDLVYVKIIDAKRGLVREGDRFGIIDDKRSKNASNGSLHSSNPKPKILGQIEITSVGSDLIMGIILDCGSFVIKGSEIAPISWYEPTHLSDPYALSSADGFNG